MKIKPIVFSFAVSIILSFVFLMAIFGIVYVYSGDLTATKDSLNTTGSYFGGVGTLATAIVAAYLFSDWKEQHNKNIDWHFSRQAIDLTQVAILDLIKSLRAFEIAKTSSLEEHKKLLKNTLTTIQDLNDKSLAILPTITHFTTEREYNEKFKPTIEQLLGKLETYETVLIRLINGQEYKNGYVELLHDIDMLCKEIITMYRKLAFELSVYYRA